MDENSELNPEAKEWGPHSPGPANPAPTSGPTAASPSSQERWDAMILAVGGPRPDSQKPCETPAEFADRCTRWDLNKQAWERENGGRVRKPDSVRADTSANKPIMPPKTPSPPPTPSMLPHEISARTGGEIPSMKKMEDLKKRTGLDLIKSYGQNMHPGVTRQHYGDLIGVWSKKDINEITGNFASELILFLEEDEEISGDISGKHGFMQARSKITYLPDNVLPFAGDASGIRDDVPLLRAMGDSDELRVIYANGYDAVRKGKALIRSVGHFSRNAEELFTLAKMEFEKAAEEAKPFQAFLDNVFLMKKHPAPPKDQQEKDKWAADEAEFRDRCLKTLDEVDMENAERERNGWKDPKTDLGLYPLTRCAGLITIVRNNDGKMKADGTKEPGSYSHYVAEQSELDLRSPQEKAARQKPFVLPVSVVPGEVKEVSPDEKDLPFTVTDVEKAKGRRFVELAELSPVEKERFQKLDDAFALELYTKHNIVRRRIVKEEIDSINQKGEKVKLEFLFSIPEFQYPNEKESEIITLSTPVPEPLPPLDPKVESKMTAEEYGKEMARRRELRKPIEPPVAMLAKVRAMIKPMPLLYTGTEQQVLKSRLEKPVVGSTSKIIATPLVPKTEPPKVETSEDEMQEAPLQIRGPHPPRVQVNLKGSPGEGRGTLLKIGGAIGRGLATLVTKPAPEDEELE